MLIDGRNRLAACKLADVEPRFAKLPAGSDPLAYIESCDTRRSVNKGQRAMATAMRYPEAQNHGGRGKKNLLETKRFSGARLSQARAVLRYSLELAQSVVKGVTPLDQAYAEVKEKQQYLMGDEAKLARLRESAPDLAEQVTDERLKINAAPQETWKEWVVRSPLRDAVIDAPGTCGCGIDAERQAIRHSP